MFLKPRPLDFRADVQIEKNLLVFRTTSAVLECSLGADKPPDVLVAPKFTIRDARGSSTRGHLDASLWSLEAIGDFGAVKLVKLTFHGEAFSKRLPNAEAAFQVPLYRAWQRSEQISLRIELVNPQGHGPDGHPLDAADIDILPVKLNYRNRRY